VRRNVDHAPATRHRLPDETLDVRAIGPVMLLDDLRAESCGRTPRRRREELRMPDRTIEVDKQTAGRRSHERRPERPGQRLCHDQRTGIVTAVGLQQRSSPAKEPSIGRRYPVAAVFTRDEKRVHRHDRSPLQLGQLAKHLSRAFAPFMAERSEICVSLIEVASFLHFEAVLFVAKQVDRHSNRQVASHGQIE
jgi:hypothetical protein